MENFLGMFKGKSEGVKKEESPSGGLLKTAVVATGIALGAAGAAEAQPMHASNGTDPRTNMSGTALPAEPKETFAKTPDKQVNFAKVNWAVQSAVRANAILNAHPFDVDGAFDVPATDRSIVAFKFIRENEQPFADMLLSPAALAKLDLNEAEWQVLEDNYERVADKNALIETKFGVPATAKSAAIQGVLLGRGEDLSRYAGVQGPRTDAMRELLSQAKLLMNEMQGQTVPEGLAMEGMNDLAKKFQAILDAGLSADEAKAARYMGALLSRELAVGAKALGLALRTPAFKMPLPHSAAPAVSVAAPVSAPLPPRTVEHAAAVPIAPLESMRQFIPRPSPLPKAEVPATPPVVEDRTQIGLMGLREVPVAAPAAPQMAPVQNIAPAFSFPSIDTVAPAAAPAVPAFPPGIVPMKPGEKIAPVKFDINSVPPSNK